MFDLRDLMGQLRVGTYIHPQNTYSFSYYNGNGSIVVVHVECELQGLFGAKQQNNITRSQVELYQPLMFPKVSIMAKLSGHVHWLGSPFRTVTWVGLTFHIT